MHFQFMNKFIPFLSVIVFLSSCTNEYISDGREVCFEQEVLPLIVSTCAREGCHNPATYEKGYDLTQYNDILRMVEPGSYRKSELYKVITSPFSPMPPKPYDRLSKEQITTISLWIEQGAQNAICMVEACDTSFVSYSSVVKPILDLYCNGCHAGPRPQGGVDYNNFNGVRTTVEDGSLISSIIRDGNTVNMPKNGNKLPDCKIQQIKKWVQDGAKNN
ncbi:MAG: c-type cytochrome [Saprospiraceae bacterium]|jgi:mono/diheme cytochrome c family protein|nr:c-type cytochrome [Saprospiraceae bacterium]MBK8296688.1 c-type cytochrome [Saprospiraceae bacterium]